jgi:hydrogenase maturation protease
MTGGGPRDPGRGMTGGSGTVVIGLGNVVMSDDGLGVHAVARLRASGRLADGIELIEGGTAGLLLLPHLADARRAIIIDAVRAGARPGTLVRLEADALARAFERHISPHDVGLRDLLGAARLSGAWPSVLVLHGIEPAVTRVGTELSAPVAASLGALVDAIVAEVADWDRSLLDGAAPPGVTEATACA